MHVLAALARCALLSSLTRGPHAVLACWRRSAPQVAALGLAFGMEVVVHSRTPADPPMPEGVRSDSMDGLLRAADYVSLHCPLNEATAGLINAEKLSLMKPTAVLINTARGGVVDQTALIAALQVASLAPAD